MSNLPRVMIAAPKSGSGKTIFTCGLLNLLKDRKDGYEGVVAFKSGPDFIDPMFHRNVIGVRSKNIDSFFSPDREVLNLLKGAKRNRAVMEGVMGIYDGIGRGSCYEIASITKTPIILIMDGRGVWNTIVSLVKGIMIDDVNHLIKGIIINRVSGKYMNTIEPLLNEMLSSIGSDAKVLGFLPQSPGISLESRHLGLKMPNEIDDLKEQVDLFSSLIEENCKLESILEIMDSAADLEDGENADGEDVGSEGSGEKGCVDTAKQAPIIGVARDEAFCFYYEENLLELERAGIAIKEFSPLHDERLPEGISGILLGGGYPELYLNELSENKSMLNSIRDALSSGMPSLAECGGFMYLLDVIKDKDNNPYSMVGHISGEAENTGRLSRFGYINIESKVDGILGKDEKIKGHEFHYFDSTNNGDDCKAQKPESDLSWDCVHNGSNHFWGYPHLYYPSNHGFVERFKRAIEIYKAKVIRDL